MLRAKVVPTLLTLLLFAGCAAHNAAVLPTTASQPATKPLAFQRGADGPWGGGQYDDIVAGPDNHMWEHKLLPCGVGFNTQIYRVNPPTQQVQILCAPGSTYMIVPGVDRMWYCWSSEAISVAKDGSSIEYKGAPYGDCSGMALGPDGNMWVTDRSAPQLIRVTPTGQFKTYPIPDQSQIPYAVVGSKSSGLVWFLSKNSVGTYVGTLNPSSGTIASFKISPWHMLAMVISTGSDGNAYVEDTAKADIVRVTPSGAIRRFDVGDDSVEDASQADVNSIWMYESTLGLVEWSVRGHALKSYGKAPDNYFPGPFFGPDGNVWSMGGVYLRRLITIAPSSATLSVGQAQSFTISEAHCPACVWKAVSSSSRIASVSPVIGNSFTVRGASVGSATIYVHDGRGNINTTDIQVQ